MDGRTKEKLVKLAEGVYVEKDVLGVVEEIQRYDPNLRIQVCARPDSPTDPPYRLVEHCRDSIDRVVFDIWELDRRVLERVWAADTSKHDILNILERKDAQARKDANRRYQEKMDEAHDMVTSYLKSPKGRYKIKDGDNEIVLDDSL